MGDVEEDAAAEPCEEDLEFDVDEEAAEEDEAFEEVNEELDEFAELDAEAGDEAAVEEADEEPQELKDKRSENDTRDRPKKYRKLISPLGAGTDKYVVRARQWLRDAESAKNFVQEINELVEKCRSSDKALVFEDFDISQNLMPLEQFEDMCSELADSCVRVERLRAFGCPTLDDSAVSTLAGWLSGVSEENAPYEMHLSDCAIQSDGFEALMKAFIENEAFPPPDPKFPDKGKLPLYLRLENNYIDPTVMEAHVEENHIIKMRKNDRPWHNTEHKVRLLIREDGGFAQKRGDPPAPEDAPPPKRVHDMVSKGKGKGDKGKKGKDDRGKNGRSDYYWQDRDRDRGKGSKKGRGSSAYAAIGDSRAPWDNRDRDRRDYERGSRSYESRSSDAYSRGDDNSGSYRSDRSGAYSRESDRGKAPREYGERYNAFGRSASDKADRRDVPPPSSRQASTRPPPPPSSRQTSSRYSDDSRKRPAGERDPYAQDMKRSRQEAPTTSARPSARATSSSSGGKGKPRNKENDNLPYPWEKHWSAEYDLHYYWNSKTGDSSWDRPT